MPLGLGGACKQCSPSGGPILLTDKSGTLDKHRGFFYYDYSLEILARGGTDAAFFQGPVPVHSANEQMAEKKKIEERNAPRSWE